MLKTLLLVCAFGISRVLGPNDTLVYSTPADNIAEGQGYFVNAVNAPFGRATCSYIDDLHLPTMQVTFGNTAYVRDDNVTMPSQDEPIVMYDDTNNVLDSYPNGFYNMSFALGEWCSAPFNLDYYVTDRGNPYTTFASTNSLSNGGNLTNVNSLYVGLVFPTSSTDNFPYLDNLGFSSEGKNYLCMLSIQTTQYQSFYYSVTISYYTGGWNGTSSIHNPPISFLNSYSISGFESTSGTSSSILINVPTANNGSATYPSLAYDTNYRNTILTIAVTPFSFNPSDTFQDGYETGYNDGYGTGMGVGLDTGYDTGYETGSSQGYETGYANGYATGTIEGNSHTGFSNLLFTIADVPIYYLKSLFNIELFGVRVYSAIFSIVTILAITYVIRKVI